MTVGARLKPQGTFTGAHVHSKRSLATVNHIHIAPGISLSEAFPFHLS